MNHKQRRHRASFNNEEDMKVEDSSVTKIPKDPRDVTYMEIKDYKMEMDDPTTQSALH
jgi:hypothetical protein